MLSQELQLEFSTEVEIERKGSILDSLAPGQLPACDDRSVGSALQLSQKKYNSALPFFCVAYLYSISWPSPVSASRWELLPIGQSTRLLFVL